MYCKYVQSLVVLLDAAIDNSIYEHATPTTIGYKVINTTT